MRAPRRGVLRAGAEAWAGRAPCPAARPAARRSRRCGDMPVRMRLSGARLNRPAGCGRCLLGQQRGVAHGEHVSRTIERRAPARASRSRCPPAPFHHGNQRRPVPGLHGGVHHHVRPARAPAGRRCSSRRPRSCAATPAASASRSRRPRPAGNVGAGAGQLGRRPSPEQGRQPTVPPNGAAKARGPARHADPALAGDGLVDDAEHGPARGGAGRSGCRTVGRPVMKARVPSIGSSTQTHSAVGPLGPVLLPDHAVVGEAPGQVVAQRPLGGAVRLGHGAGVPLRLDQQRRNGTRGG